MIKVSLYFRLLKTLVITNVSTTIHVYVNVYLKHLSATETHKSNVKISRRVKCIEMLNNLKSREID